MSIFNEPVTIAETGQVVGTGWMPPVPDLRDYTEATPEIAEMARMLGLVGEPLTEKKTGKAKGSREPMAPLASVNLKQWCSPIEDQGNLGSCTAHAAIGVVEYFERRAHGEHIEGSRLFVYKATRNLMRVSGDTGAWLRNTMGALVLCGVPDEQYWPYTDAKPDFDREPSAFVYSVADNYETIRYFCHDPQGTNVSGASVLASVKRYLTARIPSMFGFFGFPSFSCTDVVGGIPYPCPGERAQWGHAVVAVGYDDRKKITNTQCNRATIGALLIRNSWGVGWGDRGYGWLPYDYVTNRLALDFWSLLSMKWVQTRQFGVGT